MPAFTTTRTRLTVGLICALMTTLCLVSHRAHAGRIVGYLTGPWGNWLHESHLWARGVGENDGAYGDGFSWVGDYTISPLPGGSYHMAASSYGALRHVFIDYVQVPSVGDTIVDIQHQSTMSTDGNPAGITSLGMVREFGQTFVATGVELHRVMALGADTPLVQCRVTIHEGGPGGPQVGPHRDQALGMVFPAFFSWKPGELPLKPGQTYYVRVHAQQSQYFTPVIAPLEHQYPNGHLFMDGVLYPEYDAYMAITCRDDGLIYDMDHYTGWRSGTFTSVGQTFRSLGRELRLATFILANTGDSFPMRVRLFTAPGGTQIGPTKTAQMTANGPGTVVWGPGEAPTTPGETYYIELRRANNGPFAIYGDQGGYPHGQAYLDGEPVNEDLRLTLVSSEPTLPNIQTSNVATADLTPRSARVTWNSDVAAHGYVEFWRGDEPPAVPAQGFTTAQQTSHNVTLTGLQPNATYNYRVVNWRDGRAVSRSAVGQFATTATTGTLTGTISPAGGALADANVVLTPGNHRAKSAANGGYSLSLPVGTYHMTVHAFGYASTSLGPLVVNAGQTTIQHTQLTAVNSLLVNGGFENGLTNWSNFAPFDGVQNDGAWGVPAHSGATWAGNISNGNAKPGGIYQQVSVTPGTEYTAAAFVQTRSYAQTHARHGHAQARIGIDPAGGTDPGNLTVVWSRPIFTSEDWRRVSATAIATGGTVTVFIEAVHHEWWGLPLWYIVGFDDVSLTTSSTIPTPTPTRTHTPTPTLTPIASDPSILSTY